MCRLNYFSFCGFIKLKSIRFSNTVQNRAFRVVFKLYYNTVTLKRLSKCEIEAGESQIGLLQSINENQLT